ncbi:MAG: SLC13 family permease, partial [Chthoniobacterales bacterium]|nr:SLC13 family permease [Chthoniobacterales bacterium]
GQPPFALFEISCLGILYALVGSLYLLFATPYLLPTRHTLSSLLSSADTRSFCSQAIVLPNSKFIGKTFPETPLGQSRSALLFEVIRNGLRVTDTPLDQLPLKSKDILIIKCSAKDVAAIRESGDLSFDETPSSSSSEVRLVEAIIGPHSPMIGKTIRQLGLRRRYGVVAVALHRRGQNLLEKFQDIPLQFGDTLIIEGPEPNLAHLREEDDFLSLNETTHRPHRYHKAPFALLAFAAVIVLSAFEIIPILTAALIAAILVVLFGCLDSDEVYSSIDWQILFLIIGMLAIGKAIENTGLATFIAHHWATIFQNTSPQVLIASVYLLATLLTELITNNAVAIVLTPIAIEIAESLGISARPLIVAVMFAASASFCTPVGYQTNTYVFGAGGYKFSDFLRIGVPLNLLLLLTASILIPIFWPLK